MSLVTCSQIQLFPPLYMVKRFADADIVVVMEEVRFSAWSLDRTGRAFDQAVAFLHRGTGE